MERNKISVKQYKVRIWTHVYKIPSLFKINDSKAWFPGSLLSEWLQCVPGSKGLFIQFSLKKKLNSQLFICILKTQLQPQVKKICLCLFKSAFYKLVYNRIFSRYHIVYCGLLVFYCKKLEEHENCCIFVCIMCTYLYI